MLSCLQPLLSRKAFPVFILVSADGMTGSFVSQLRIFQFIFMHFLQKEQQTYVRNSCSL